MADYRLKLAKFTWGAGFANTLTLAYRLDNVRTWSEPREGSSFEQSPAGVEDSWIVGEDFYLSADVRYVAVGTQWDGATGVRAFLAWGRQKGAVRFFPDKDAIGYVESYLVDPAKGGGDLEQDGTRKVSITIRNATTEYAGY
jgi:hypothetical protein